jgi:tryptophanyl-tRNA synthetase
MSASLSLVVPSGHLTLGNLLGAVRRWTTDQRVQVGVLLAAGLDPQRCTIFVQSQLPAHTELLWLWESTVHVGELHRMVQFDILLYGAEEVPVGDDHPATALRGAGYRGA